ncbi:DUF4180 domain-containing protein [Lysobacter enzymogenes]|uniref:DUF4180 domain-containing protein n=1 Tax=Lysobacter enzymogenes TaxID=69 RepID=UPI001A97AEC6|nr:DUF4180 domain-containing protein [Lysobacter enzymogenes]QQP97527.1 DUF4180 domain-containing protein [Lysobacter enzymogenes]
MNDAADESAFTVLPIGSERVLLCAAEGAPIADARAATDLIGAASFAGATVLALPVARLDVSFFRLASGLAGEIAQKAVNYRLRLAVVGDIQAHLRRSAPLRDWVRECGEGRAVMFVDDLDALARILGRE